MVVNPSKTVFVFASIALVLSSIVFWTMFCCRGFLPKLLMLMFITCLVVLTVLAFGCSRLVLVFRSEAVRARRLARLVQVAALFTTGTRRLSGLLLIYSNSAVQTLGLSRLINEMSHAAAAAG